MATVQLHESLPLEVTHMVVPSHYVCIQYLNRVPLTVPAMVGGIGHTGRCRPHLCSGEDATGPSCTEGGG